MRKTIIITLAAISFFSCKTQHQSQSLQETFNPYFYIGVAINNAHISGGDYDGGLLIKKHFNSITPENIMKWEQIHPEQNRYNFSFANDFVALGEQDSMFIVGHTLVWHSQLAPWVQAISDSARLDAVMKEHIYRVMGEYKGKIDGWDVVNEALNEDGTLRESFFFKVIGPDYIKQAFEYAHEVDSSCELYYNDYNLVNTPKREGAIRIIKELQAQGVKIDGVGMQGHWNLNWPSLEAIEESIIAYSELGIKVMITELDITVLPNPWDLEGADVNQNFEESEKMNPYPNFLPDSVDILLAKRYEDIFNIFLKHHDKISRVTFWGVHDGDSWLNNWPIRGRTNYPLVFNRNYKPKRAYKLIMKTAEKYSQEKSE
ncbi:MAG: endo-1,4-beta-xylanase [Bacteroidales bacterium]|jgi:endo-1,4-beta-xylanase|nr:endo-1,4-beta-xylanase [Bacteroidales bacterium]